MIRVITPREELTDIEEIKVYLRDLESINEEGNTEVDNYSIYNTEKIIYGMIEFVEEFESRNYNIVEIDTTFNLIDFENMIQGR